MATTVYVRDSRVAAVDYLHAERYVCTFNATVYVNAHCLYSNCTGARLATTFLHARDLIENCHIPQQCGQYPK